MRLEMLERNKINFINPLNNNLVGKYIHHNGLYDYTDINGNYVRKDTLFYRNNKYWL